MLRKLATHTAIYGLAPHISKIASIFVLPIVTQFLTPVDYGVYGVITATVGSISVLSSLGLRVVLVNSFYKSPHRYKWVWRQIYGFLSIWVIPYAVLSGTLVYFIIPEEAKHHVWEIIAINVLPLVFFGQTSTLATTYYQINKKPFPIAIRTALFGTLTVLLNLYMIAVLKMGYMGWFWSTFIVNALNNISYWIPLNYSLGIRPIFKFKWRLMKNSLRISLPTVPHYYSTYLLNASDKMVMEFLKVPTENIGKYNVAYTFGNYFNNLGVAAGFAVGPILNECYKRGEELKARNLIFILQVVFFAMTFLISIWMRELLSFFIQNDALNQVYNLSVIIVMGYNYRPMYFGSNAKLLYTEKTKVLWRVSFIAGATNVLLNIIFVSWIGYEAAAFTTFASLMYMGYAGFFLNDFRSDNRVNYYPMLWLAATVILTAIAYVIVYTSVWNKVIITAIVSPIFGYLLLRIRKMLHESKRNR
ncbi:lipopolysaccharide biosynthesis protein [Pseudochryseolinea flava]|uniref:Lipopolysaccharide biosynthesis protein n=1 Tax=Pseudochryseolinea flava TaxID=2059302 RepID=A0A364Y3B5_9BACT|nr:oligosaccharide flippase family protein [Pseudochryseolinea flava]RAW01300.1 lipopolysaccharide biosynthesis protein [Pseudochryseolinea flava]